MKTLEEQLASALDAADLHGVITLETLSSLIAAQNLDMPAGYVYDENGNGIIVTVGDAIADGEDLENLVLLDLGIEGLDPIRVCDVADVVRADNAGEIYASLNGNDGLILMFSKQSNYATAKVSDNINAAFEELSAQYPGLTFTALMDQGDYIYLLRDSILSSLLLGRALLGRHSLPLPARLAAHGHHALLDPDQPALRAHAHVLHRRFHQHHVAFRSFDIGRHAGG